MWHLTALMFASLAIQYGKYINRNSLVLYCC